MKIKLIALLTGAMLALPVMAQTQTPTGTFFGTVQSYFTSFNTNLDSTFTSQRGSLWTGVDSIQGGKVPLANCLGISYDVYRPGVSSSNLLGSGVRISLESVTRNSGIAGTVLSEGIGAGLSFVVHDTRLTAYADGLYAFGEATDKFGAELGLRVSKALTEHTFAGVGIAVQLPANRQVLSAIVGFTF